jgi:hypothetical protein
MKVSDSAMGLTILMRGKAVEHKGSKFECCLLPS